MREEDKVKIESLVQGKFQEYKESRVVTNITKINLVFDLVKNIKGQSDSVVIDGALHALDKVGLLAHGAKEISTQMGVPMGMEFAKFVLDQYRDTTGRDLPSSFDRAFYVETGVMEPERNWANSGLAGAEAANGGAAEEQLDSLKKLFEEPRQGFEVKKRGLGSSGQKITIGGYKLVQKKNGDLMWGTRVVAVDNAKRRGGNLQKQELQLLTIDTKEGVDLIANAYAEFAHITNPTLPSTRISNRTSELDGNHELGSSAPGVTHNPDYHSPEPSNAPRGPWVSKVTSGRHKGSANISAGRGDRSTHSKPASAEVSRGAGRWTLQTLELGAESGTGKGGIGR